MRVFLQEWKKIWRPGILVALLVLGLAYFYLFSNFYIEYFCNGPTAQAEFDLASEWVEAYGPTMEPEERQALDQQLEEEKATFAQEIADYGPAAALGITTYDAFASYQQAYYTAVQEQDGEADMETEQFLHKMMDNTNYYRITELENYLSAYDGKADTPWSQQEGFLSYTGEEQAQIQRLEDGGRGFLPDAVQFSTINYAKHLAIWSVLSVVLLLSPTFVRDRLYHTRAVQWSSRTGRRVWKVQLAAGLCGAVVLTLCNVVLYAIPFVGKGPLRFWDCPLFHWCRDDYTWFGGTYGQYLLVLVGMVLLLGVAAGGMTMFLSQYSGQYVAMLLKAIPLFLVVGVLAGGFLLNRPYYFRTIYLGDQAVPVPPGGEAILLGSLILLSVVLLFWACRRQNRREL